MSESSSGSLGRELGRAWRALGAEAWVPRPTVVSTAASPQAPHVYLDEGGASILAVAMCYYFNIMSNIILMRIDIWARQE